MYGYLILQIKMADVDFWATGCNVDAMKLRHDYELYPPRVIVNWIPVGKQQEYSTLRITVTGCTIDSDLNNDVTLPLGKQTIKSTSTCIN